MELIYILNVHPMNMVVGRRQDPFVPFLFHLPLSWVSIPCLDASLGEHLNTSNASRV